MGWKHHKVVGKKSTISAEYEYGLTPSLFDLDFSVKVVPNINAIKKDFVDTEIFKYEWLNKNFTERAFVSKLRSIRIPDFDSPFVTFTTQFDEKSIDLKRPKQIRFKITVSLEAKDDNTKYTV